MPSRHKREFARVELDGDTVYKFESFIRDGLVASGAVSKADNKKLKKRATHVTVSLDAKALARLSELLREGLMESGFTHQSNYAALNNMTGKVR